MQMVSPLEAMAIHSGFRQVVEVFGAGQVSKGGVPKRGGWAFRSARLAAMLLKVVRKPEHRTQCRVKGCAGRTPIGAGTSTAQRCLLAMNWASEISEG